MNRNRIRVAFVGWVMSGVACGVGFQGETLVYADPISGGVSRLSGETLSSSEAKALLLEFTRAQATQLRSQESKNQIELKEFKISQDTKFKEWKLREQDARHQFFDEHRSGSERRTYIQSYVQRRDAFLKELISSKKGKAQELDLKLNGLTQEHSQKLQEVKKILEQGKRPDPSYWPAQTL